MAPALSHPCTLEFTCCEAVSPSTAAGRSGKASQIREGIGICVDGVGLISECRDRLPGHTACPVEACTPCIHTSATMRAKLDPSHPVLVRTEHVGVRQGEMCL
jgi:hypothetical protein